MTASDVCGDDGTVPEVSIVVPCYNEEENVTAIHAAIAKEVRQHAQSYEIIFIDNFSTDRTRSLILELCRQDTRVKAIFNNRNYGQIRSPTHAIFQAAGQAVIAMCADFQDPPELIGPMIAHWHAGAEIVLGQRRSEKASAGVLLSRKFGYALLGAVSDYPIIPGATGFGLFSRRCLDVLIEWNEPEPFFRGMVVESGFPLVTIPFNRPQRVAGRSKNNFMTLLAFSLSSLSASAKGLLRVPLTLAPPIGVLAIALLVVALGVVLSGRTGSAIIMLIAIQLGIFAILLFFIGVMSDQIRLISERTRRVPLVVEERRINFAHDRQTPRQIGG